MKLLDLIHHSAARLEQSGVCFGHGTLNAFDEACWLVLWRLGLPLDELDGVADRPCTADEVRAVDQLISHRIDSRQPVAYITQEAWLQGLPFYVDERVIIPRSLIAEPLAEGVLDALLGAEPERVWDLCTGNGSLAVLSALAWPEAQVLATDLSGEALEVARINVGRHGVGARVHTAQGDGLQARPATHKAPFNLLLCNPPYVNADAMARLPAEFLAEPTLALHGGHNGMDFIGPLLQGVAAHLAPEGWLVLEIGHEREHFEAAFPGLEPLWLSTSAGDDQVLALSAAELQRWSATA